MDIETKFSLECKKMMMRELRDQFKASDNFIVTNYFGTSSNDLNELRQSLKVKAAKYFVVKNRIAKRVFEDLGLKDAKALIKDGVGISFIKEDPVETTKLIVNFAKKHESFQIKGAYIDGRALDLNKIKELAALPSREVLLTMIASSMLSPISGFVGVLSGILRKFVYVINAIKEKKEKGGESK